MIPVGVAFSNIGAQDGAYTIGEEAFTGAAEEGDQMITFDGDFWNVNQYDKGGASEGWVLTPADGGDQVLVNDDESVLIPAGGAVYYIPMQTTTWTVTL